MTSTLDTPDQATAIPDGPELDPKRFRALAIIAVAQLMVVLDASVVIIALPSAQRALHISTANRQWMLTAYTLSFAGLLLLGGRIADYFGRKRMFVISLVGFAAASALGGLAENSAMLFSARALQGAFAAIMAPAALSLLTVAFTEPKERARAFAVYGGIAGGGAAIGLILGGFLTEFASWRWTLLINVPIAIVAAVAAFRFVTESRASSNHGYDMPGAVTVTGGLLALVYGFTKAGTDGWASSTTVSLFAIAAVLLVAFVIIEQRVAAPTPAAACRPRAQPWRVVPGLPPGGRRHAGHLPVADLLLPGDAALLRPQVRVRLRAVLARHHHRSHIGQPAPAPLRATGRHDRRPAPRHGRVAPLHHARACSSAYLTVVLPAEVIVSLGMGLVVRRHEQHGPDRGGARQTPVWPAHW